MNNIFFFILYAYIFGTYIFKLYFFDFRDHIPEHSAVFIPLPSNRPDDPGGTEISVKRSMTVEQPIPVPSDVGEQKNIERAMTVAEYCV